MKKALLTIALAAFALAANAQFLIGGSLGFGMFSGSTNYTGMLGTTTTERVFPCALANPSAQNDFNSLNETMILTVLPKIGYQLNDKMQAGLSFGIMLDNRKDHSMYFIHYYTYENFEGWESSSQLAICATPYLRYNLIEKDDFTIFAEAQLGVTLGLNPKFHRFQTEYNQGAIHHEAIDADIEGKEYTYTDIALNIIPGVNYRMSDRCSLDLYVNLLRLGFEYKNEDFYQDQNLINNTLTNPADAREWVVNSTNILFSAGNGPLISLGFNYHFF